MIHGSKVRCAPREGLEEAEKTHENRGLLAGESEEGFWNEHPTWNPREELSTMESYG
jgi:hypothetical protein